MANWALSNLYNVFLAAVGIEVVCVEFLALGTGRIELRDRDSLHSTGR